MMNRFEISNNRSHLDQLQDQLSQKIAHLGYEIIYLETELQPKKILRAYIDYLESTKVDEKIRIEDCVTVSHCLSPLLDELLTEEHSYDLEVSSPGLQRPLKSKKDFQRFKGSTIRVQLLRALTGQELNNSDYAEKNPRQKKWLGIIAGLSKNEDSLLVDIPPLKAQVTLPFELISEANLEPFADFGMNFKNKLNKNEREKKT